MRRAGAVRAVGVGLGITTSVRIAATARSSAPGAVLGVLPGSSAAIRRRAVTPPA